MSLLIGMDFITEHNWKEFWIRTYMWQTAFGACYRDGDNNEVSLTPMDIKNHIGAETNVSQQSFSCFRNNFAEHLRNDAVRVMNEQIEHKEDDLEGDDDNGGSGAELGGAGEGP